MERWQIWILAAIIVVFVAALIVAGYISQRMAGAPAAISTTKRFSAAPGAMREKAVPLISRKRTAGESVSSPSESYPQETASQPLLSRAQSLDNEQPRESEEAQIAAAALQTETPQEGIQQIMAALEAPHAPEQAAHLYAALGQLHAQANPQNLSQAIAAYEQALQKADGQEMHALILEQQIPLLVKEESPAYALERIESFLSDNAPQTLPAIRLRTISGGIHEEAGELEKALSAYQRAFEDTLQTLDTHDDADDTLRVTGLRYSRLLRAMGRFEDAKSVASRVKKTLESRLLPDNPSR